MMEKLFTLARELATPQVWSSGVELSRNAEFEGQGQVTPSEVTVRILQGSRDRIHTVSLSENEELWQCDCASDVDPCRHIIATILAARQERITSAATRVRGSRAGELIHAFTTNGSSLRFERFFDFGETKIAVSGTLLQAIALLQRDKRHVSPMEEELRIDYVLPAVRDGLVDARTMRHLVPALSRVRTVTLNGDVIRASAKSLAVEAEVVDDTNGYRLRRVLQDGVGAVFDNGAAVRNGELCAVEDSALRMEEVELLKDGGTVFSPIDSLELVTRVIPALQGKITVHIRSRSLPRARRVAPRIVIDAMSDEEARSLTIVPRLVYGDPVIATVNNNGLDLLDPREIPVRDPIEEARLARDTQLKLGVSIGKAVSFEGASAIAIAKQLSQWKTTGDGVARFTPQDDLTALARGEGGALEIFFQSDRGDSLPAEEVLRQWKMGISAVRLSSGQGWAALPTEWLQKHAVALEKLLNARQTNKILPAHLFPEVCELSEATDIDPPAYFSRLRRGLEDLDAIPQARLPADLRATLRPYQIQGVNWLAFLHEHGLGALLADDMGLGKTLQALCVVKGRTLVVCPTSVLSSWRKQIEVFRPGLQVSTYHGPARHLTDTSDVVLTSYAILRLDREVLCAREWDTLILDEAQTIRNPESQVAQAAYAVQAKARINLSGTPVENSLDDLWSQYHVLNPGLLGSLSSFRESFASPISDGDSARAAELRRRISPFIMRRLKQEVAKELPPKTEVVLECELSADERAVYEAVLGGVRGELLEQLNQGASVFSILEALLRLRQACCHTGLLPGHHADSSSKLELLLETVERSIAQGHRALIFSQWTTLLDLVEPHLTTRSLDFLRIDGSTESRGDLVDEFQSADGPPIMLLSLKAGGLGITLTRADHVYILDPWWNPAVEDQAADRAYRIGQENPVVVHRLVARDTIEARILELQASKRTLLEAAIGGRGTVALSRDEIIALVTP